MTSAAALPVPGPDCPPFVLLDDARVDGAAPARLFRNPVEIATAHSAAELPALLATLEAARRRGLHAYPRVAVQSCDCGVPIRARRLFQQGRRNASTSEPMHRLGFEWRISQRVLPAVLSPRSDGCAVKPSLFIQSPNAAPFHTIALAHPSVPANAHWSSPRLPTPWHSAGVWLQPQKTPTGPVPTPRPCESVRC